MRSRTEPVLTGHKRSFPDAPGHDVRCPACGRLLFVARCCWIATAVERAEIVLICPARRGGWSCKALVPLVRCENEGRPT